MTDFTVVPCFKCICVPVCRHKGFHDLYFDCQIIQEYFTVIENDKHMYHWIEAILNPSKWYTDPEDRSRVLKYEKDF